MRRERAEHGAACSFEIGNRRDGGSASRSAERRGVRSGCAWRECLPRGACGCVGLCCVAVSIEHFCEIDTATDGTIQKPAVVIIMPDMRCSAK